MAKDINVTIGASNAELKAKTAESKAKLKEMSGELQQGIGAGGSASMGRLSQAFQAFATGPVAMAGAAISALIAGIGRMWTEYKAGLADASKDAADFATRQERDFNREQSQLEKLVKINREMHKLQPGSEQYNSVQKYVMRAARIAGYEGKDYNAQEVDAVFRERARQNARDAQEAQRELLLAQFDEITGSSVGMYAARALGGGKYMDKVRETLSSGNASQILDVVGALNRSGLGRGTMLGADGEQLRNFMRSAEKFAELMHNTGEIGKVSGLDAAQSLINTASTASDAVRTGAGEGRAVWIEQQMRKERENLGRVTYQQNYKWLRQKYEDIWDAQHPASTATTAPAAAPYVPPVPAAGMPVNALYSVGGYTGDSMRYQQQQQMDKDQLNTQRRISDAVERIAAERRKVFP